MGSPWNLTTTEWSTVLQSGTTPEAVAASMRGGESIPWTQILLRSTAPGSRVLDLGSGRGEHSAALALAGRKTTLADWSVGNLDFSRSLYRALGQDGRFSQVDMTKTLPFAAGSFDLVFSCGVFEYFSTAQIEAILREMFRVARERVIVMIPNALSLPYRFGMWYQVKTGNWPWGGEVPSYSLRRPFRRAGSAKIEEFSVAAGHSLDFLTMRFGSYLRKALAPVLVSSDESRPALLRQGYLLVTIGLKESAVACRSSHGREG